MERRPTRQRILDAAHELMGTVGLARATTKEIARAAGCSEAALYKHFASKEELFICVLKERLPRLTPLLDDPGEQADDERGIEERLTEITRRAALFYEQSFPIAASLYAEKQLKRRHDDALRRLGAGPHKPIEGLACYLRAEQRRGRIAPDADPFAAASLLLGACSQRAFAFEMSPGGDPRPLDEFATSVVRTLLAGIAPRAASEEAPADGPGTEAAAGGPGTEAPAGG